MVATARAVIHILEAVEPFEPDAQVEAPTESFVGVPQSILRSEITKERAELRMAKPFLLVSRVESQIRNSSDCRAARVGARVQVHKNVRLLDAKRCVPTIV